MLLEISNNAIETLLKKYNPVIKDAFNFTLSELDTWELVQLNPNTSLAGYTILNYIGIPKVEIKAMPNMKIKDYLRLKLLKEFEINRGNGPIKYLRGIIRICCDEREGINYFTYGLKDENKLTKFRQIVDFIYTNNLEFDEDLNGLSLIQLHKLIGSKMRITAYQNWLANRKSQDDGIKKYGDYTVIPITCYEDATKYSRYTSWCVTSMAGQYGSYTSDGSKFFFCLKDGFENVKQKIGDGCPLDEYGLSMVSVLVRPNCTAKHVTTRWNHENKGEDNPKLKTLEQVEEILGIPKNAFTDSIVPEIEFNDLQELIDMGVDISRLVITDEQFGKLKLVKFKNANGNFFYNTMIGNKLLSDVWYDKSVAFKNKYFCLTRYSDEGMVRNIFDEKGKIFPEDIHYAISGVFDEKRDIFTVHNSRRSMNLIRRGSSDLLLPEDVYRISEFVYGYAIIETVEGYTNVLTENLTFLWDEPVRMGTAYFRGSSNKESKLWSEGMLIMKNSFGNETYMDISTRKPITDQWFDECFSFENGIGKVQNDNFEMNLIKRDGTLMFDVWCDSIEKFANRDYFRVKIRHKGETVINMDGNLIMDRYWQQVFDYTGEYGCAKNGNNVVAFDAEGNELFSVEGFMGLVFDYMFLIISYGEISLYDKTGKLICNNMTVVTENGDFDIQLPKNYWCCLDNDKNIYYLYDIKQDTIKTFTDIEQIREYIGQ
jgi:hypothetical protein